MEFIHLLKDFGPVLGVILFFIWRDWKREDRFIERITALEVFQQETLISLIRETNEVVSLNTEQLKLVTFLLVRGEEDDN